MTEADIYAKNLLKTLQVEQDSVEGYDEKGNYFSLERDNDRWYIIVTHESGSKMYDGYAPCDVLSPEDAVKEAVYGSQAYMKD